MKSSYDANAISQVLRSTDVSDWPTLQLAVIEDKTAD